MADLSQYSNEQLMALARGGDQTQQPSPGISQMSTEDLMKIARGQPRTSTTEALGRGLAQGVSFNFADELEAMTRAGGAKPYEGDIGHLATGLWKYARGDPEAVRQYNEAVEAERQRQKLVEEEHPVASTLGQLGGALVVPAGGAAKGLTWGQRALRSGAIGAGFGAASGLGEGTDLQSRLGQAATGGLVGGAVGTAFSPLAELALQGGRKLVGPSINTLRGAYSPEAEASRRVAGALAQDAPVTERLTAQELAATPAATVMDTGDTATRALAQAAKNVSPEAERILKGTIDPRFEGQSDRINHWLNENHSYPNPEATQAAIDEVERTTNKANYATAYSKGAGPIMTDNMQHWTDYSPAFRDAIQRATTEVQNRSALGLGGAVNPGIRFEAGMPVFDRGHPNLQFWDTVKRELDRAARSNPGGTEGELSKGLRAELDNVVPEYKTARQGAAQYFNSENAMEAGTNFFHNRMTPDEGRKAMARFTDTEKALFRDSFIREYMDKIAGASDRTNILNRINNSPLAREKINVVLGSQKAQELEAMLRTEGIMQKARGAISGHSTTAMQLAAIAGLTGGDYEFGVTGHPTMTGLLAAGAAVGRHKVDQKVMARVAEMLTSRDLNISARGQKIAARSQGIMDALRHVDTLTAKTAGTEAGTRGRPAF